MKKSNSKENGLNLELDENLAQGTYSNLALINHSVSEFVVDFINVMPGVPKACLLYTSPSPRDKRQSRMPCCA